MLRHIINILLWFLPPSRFFKFRSICLKLAQVEIGDNVSVCGRGWVYGRGHLSIGNDTWLSPGVVFYTHKDAYIVVENNCDIGPSVEFITGSHLIGTSARRAGYGSAKPIVVGAGTWIGARSSILGGVKIGEGCVVAACSVVTQDIPSNCLVAGVPAQVKRKL